MPRWVAASFTSMLLTAPLGWFLRRRIGRQAGRLSLERRGDLAGALRTAELRERPLVPWQTDICRLAKAAASAPPARPTELAPAEAPAGGGSELAPAPEGR
jgi:hypothetical protein